MDNRPIGIFDSGLGGLTAVLEMQNILPGEDIVYFGDTGRVPYGTRSRETIIKYTREDINFLLKKDVKLIIAACGTVSSVALPTVISEYDLKIVGVVDSTCNTAVKATKNGRIGAIGTAATVKSGIYKNQIKKADGKAEVFERACPLFVPLVENGYINRDNEISKLVVREYLEPLKEKEIDTLILGCTHFPLLSEIIDDYFEGKVALINSGAEVVKETKKYLMAEDLLNEKSNCGERKFFVSDTVEGFKNMADLIFGESTYHGNISRAIVPEG